MGDVNLLPEEQTFDTEIISPKAQKITSGVLFDNIEQIKAKYHLNSPSYIYINPTLNGKKALMYGDSMFGSWNMTELLAENFSDFTCMWTYDIQQETIDTVKPDIVFYDMESVTLTRYIQRIYD